MMEQEQLELRAAIERLSDPKLKTHMLNALSAFDTGCPSTGEKQASSDSNDAIAITLRTKDVTTKSPRDALFLAVHAILLEIGYTIVNPADSSDSFPLPADWDANSGIGLFTGTYKHPNDLTISYELQGLCVGDKFEVYISTERRNTHSIELSIDNFVALSATTSNAGDLLRDLPSLRSKLTPFFQNLAPKTERVTNPDSTSSALPRPPPSQDDSTGAPSSPFIIPPIGSGDVLPPGLGGGDPSMQVGPDHPIFGQHYDPTRGPVPGARFDPFGPISIDPQGPPRGFVGRPTHPHPAPHFPFGDPNPDHLRMPRDDDMNDSFGMDRGRSGPSQGFGSGFLQPFGSGNSFF